MPSILIIENDPIIAETIRYQLDRAGYQIIGVENDCWEALYNMRRDHSGLDIVLLTYSPKTQKEHIWLSQVISFLYPTKVLLLSSCRNTKLLEENSFVLHKPFTNIQLEESLQKILT